MSEEFQRQLGLEEGGMSGGGTILIGDKTCTIEAIVGLCLR